MNSQTELATYRIPSENMPSLTARFAKLARKAVRLGQAVSMAVVGAESETYTASDGLNRVRSFSLVQVDGAAPKVAGWAFVATLEHTAEGVIVRGVPGQTTEGELRAYRSSVQECEHCGLVRRRIDTFVLRNDKGVTRQIGRNCLRDFIGHESPEALAAYAELLCDLDLACEGEGGAGGGDGEHPMAIEDFLALTAACVRRFGFVSKAKAEERNQASTAAEVGYVVASNHKCAVLRDGATGPHCYGRKGCGYDRRGGHVGILPADRETAEATLAWVRGHDLEGLSDYLYNLVVACRHEAVEARRFGIVASAVAAYLREQGRLAARAEERKASLNEHYGTPGVRGAIAGLTVKKVVALETNYGVSHLHTFKDAQGRAFKWFSSSAVLDEGVTYNVVATVKAHEYYRDLAQTALTRVSVR